VLDYESRFRKNVIQDFADSYARGETPIPCVRCNERVKFADLLDTARELGAEALATGHYVRRIEGAHGAELHAAADSARDQSYFLFTTTQAQLDYLRFPLGDMEKTDVRAIAAELGLVNADKPDSQDICFVPAGRYTQIVGRIRPDTARPGEIVDQSGAVLGRHDGIANFTVGQRKGLGVASPSPLYVLQIDPASRRVTVGADAELATRTLRAGRLNWISIPALSGPMRVRAKIRHRHEPAWATIEPCDVSEVLATFDEPQRAVTPGQSAVFYDGDEVVGGGWIV
jgi:tRNA-uridine 2-sulfurtransferase